MKMRFKFFKRRGRGVRVQIALMRFSAVMEASLRERCGALSFSTNCATRRIVKQKNVRLAKRVVEVYKSEDKRAFFLYHFLTSRFIIRSKPRRTIATPPQTAN